MRKKRLSNCPNCHAEEKRVENGAEEQREMGKKMLFYGRRTAFRVRRTTYGECETMLYRRILALYESLSYALVWKFPNVDCRDVDWHTSKAAAIG